MRRGGDVRALDDSRHGVWARGGISRASERPVGGERNARNGVPRWRFGAEGAARAHLQLRGKRESLELGGERV